MLSTLKNCQIVLNGAMGSALDKTIVNRLKKIDYVKLVDPFRFRNENDYRWRCEFWGKVVRSLILAWKDTGDAELLKIIEATVKDILSTQTEDGCISSYPADKQLSGWDIWGRKYVLLGLMRYYEMVNPDAEVLRACCRMIDHLYSQFTAISWQGVALKLYHYGEHGGLAASSILCGLVKLYRNSGEKQFLKYAEELTEAGCCNVHNIFEMTMLDVPPALQSNGKAYEMTSCYEGLCEMYMLTKNPQYLEIARKYYNDVLGQEIFVTGGAGLKDVWGEYWFMGGKLQTRKNVGGIGETCVTVTWMHYCDYILRLTGDSKVADELEKSIYNALLGAMMPSGEGWMHLNVTPLSGAASKKRVGDQIPGFANHDCCLAQGPEGIAMVPQYTLMGYDCGVVLNGYENAKLGFEVNGAKASIAITGGYPAYGKVKVTVTADAEFGLKLRMPSWSKTIRVTVAGEGISAVPGTYLELKRKWSGTTEISLEFDMSVRKVAADDGSGLVAFYAGPLVLAQDSRLTQVDKPIDNGTWTRMPDADGFICRWTNGTDVLCDYASAGNEFSENNKLRVWLEMK